MKNDYLKLKELYHSGVKGQKWGIRRYQNEDGTLTAEGKAKYGNVNPYTKQQYERDKQLYGLLGAARINKKMLKGTQVSGARTKEADRVDVASRIAKINGKIGAITGAFAGGAAAAFIGSRIKSTGNEILDGTLGSLLMVGGAAVGSLLGRIGGRSSVMMTAGYSPLKIRD